MARFLLKKSLAFFVSSAFQLKARPSSFTGTFGNSTCRICYVEPTTTAIVPCFHLVLCKGCAALVGDCPVCRRPKVGVQRILPMPPPKRKVKQQAFIETSVDLIC